MTNPRILAAIAFAFAAGCASVLSSSAAAASSPTSAQVLSTVPPATPTPFHATPIWRYTLPAAWDRFSVHLEDHTIVAAGRGDSFALDATSGKRLWQIHTTLSPVALRGSLAYGTPDGAVVLRAARTGTLTWRTPHVCKTSPPPYGPETGPIGVLIHDHRDLLAGCDGGTLVRISASSGTILRRAHVLSTQRIAKIEPLGPCSFGVTGWSDGAALVESMSIVECRDFRPIVPQRNETDIIGAVGDTAILDDTCCFGRPDVYRPATIIRANLSTGEVSDPLDLRPEPARYPANSRPLRQGSRVFLDGGDLYLAVDHALYDYGNALGALTQPHRVSDALMQPPAMIGEGLIAVRQSTKNGSIIDEIARLEDGMLRPIWTSREMRYEALGPIPDIPGVVFLGSRSVRVRPLAGVVLPLGCQLVAAGTVLAIAVCTPGERFDTAGAQYVAAFRWVPVATPRRSGGL